MPRGRRVRLSHLLFMTAAIPLYERLGYRRAPEFDLDMNTHYGSTAAKPWTAIAYLRCLPTQPDPPQLKKPSTTPNGEHHDDHHARK